MSVQIAVQHGKSKVVIKVSAELILLLILMLV